MQRGCVGFETDPQTKKVVAVKIKNLETGQVEQVTGDYFFSAVPIKNLVAGLTPAAPAKVLVIKVDDNNLKLK